MIISIYKLYNNLLIKTLLKLKLTKSQTFERSIKFDLLSRFIGNFPIIKNMINIKMFLRSLEIIILTYICFLIYSYSNIFFSVFFFIFFIEYIRKYSLFLITNFSLNLAVFFDNYYEEYDENTFYSEIKEVDYAINTLFMILNREHLWNDSLVEDSKESEGSEVEVKNIGNKIATFNDNDVFEYIEIEYNNELLRYEFYRVSNKKDDEPGLDEVMYGDNIFYILVPPT